MSEQEISKTFFLNGYEVHDKEEITRAGLLTQEGLGFTAVVLRFFFCCLFVQDASSAETMSVYLDWSKSFAFSTQFAAPLEKLREIPRLLSRFETSFLENRDPLPLLFACREQDGNLDMPKIPNYIGAEGALSTAGAAGGEAAPMEGRAVGIDLVRTLVGGTAYV